MSDGVASGSPVPISRPGIAVWRFLRAEGRRYAVTLLAYPNSAPELIYQAWVIAMRRTFSRSVDDQLACEYLERVIGRVGASTSTSHVAELVDMALGNARVGSRKAKSDLLPVLIDLVKNRFPNDDQSAELMRTAEIRVDRLRRKRQRGQPRERLNALPTSGPRSVVGQILKAQAAYDQELLLALPVEESDEVAAEVVGRAVAAAIRERFLQSPSPERVAKFVDRVTRSSRDPRLDATVAEAVIRDALTFRSNEVTDLPLDLLLHAKVMTFVQAVEDLGMYDREVEEIIVAAERASEDAGIRLTILS